MSTIHGWITLGVRPERLQIRSELYELREHFLDSKLRSCKCIGEGCILCATYPLQISACVAVSRERGGQIRLLRITPACYAQLLATDSCDLLSVGRIISCANIGRERREGMELEALESQTAKEVQIARYVAAIGQRAYNQAAGLFESANRPDSGQWSLASA